MKFVKYFKARNLVSCLLVVNFLTACGGGGGGGSDAPDIANEAPSVTITAPNRGIEKETISMVAVANDIDGTVSQYIWSIDNAGVELIGSNTANINFVAPNVEEDTQYTISLTVTDNDGATASSSINFTSEPITEALWLVGQAIDEELVNAAILIEVGDESFETQANAFGHFGKEIIVDERNFEHLVKITAYGHSDHHPGTKLVSLLPSFNTLLHEQANNFDTITIVENFAVNVTNLTTAKYLVAEQINNDQPIVTETDYNLAYSQLSIDEISDLLKEKLSNFAAVLKILVDGDHEAHTLPATISDTFELLSSAEFQTVLTAIAADGDLLAVTLAAIDADGAITEFPDLDGDGITNDLDEDIDGDGVNNVDEAGNKLDYYPYDDEEWAPHISDLIFTDDRPDTAVFDYLMRSCIQRSLSRSGEGDEDDYRDTSVLAVTTLDCRAWQTADTAPLKHFHNLTELLLSETLVTDISPLVGLTKLNVLDLSGLTITNFSVLSELTTLEELNLTSSNFSDMSLLASVNKLTTLKLGLTPIQSLEIESGFTLNHYFSELMLLDISSTQISDLTPLSGLSKLTELHAQKAKVSVLPDFLTLPLVNTLTLYNNQLTDISALSDLLNFTTLDLHGNQIISVEVLNALTNLTSLDLSDNKITSINGLATLVNLTSLNLAGQVDIDGVYLGNNINDLTALATLTKLASLDIRKTGITDISALSTLINLEYLYADNNQIDNLIALALLTNLKELNLSTNTITDVSTLMNWSKLPLNLNLSGNTFSCADDDALATAAQAQGTTYVNGEKCVTKVIIIGGPFGVEDDGELLPTKTIGQVFEKITSDRDNSSPNSNNFGVAHASALTCIYGLDYPICYRASIYGGNPDCSAEANSQYMTCQPDEFTYNEETYQEPSFTVDFDPSIQPNNEVIVDFEDRLILHVLKTPYFQLDALSGFPFGTMPNPIICSALVDGVSQCTMTGVYFTGEITWQQNHTNEYYPSCNGIGGQTIVTCQPQVENFGDDNTSPTFTVELSTIEIMTKEARDALKLEPCDPNVDDFCTGVSW